MITQSLNEIISRNRGGRSALSSHRIDYCYGGNESLKEACREKNVDPGSVVSAIGQISSLNEALFDFSSYPADLLAEFIVKRHHSYLEDHIPQIKKGLEELAEEYGPDFCSLPYIQYLFGHVSRNLDLAIKKEEWILSCYVKTLSSIAPEEENKGSRETLIRSFKSDQHKKATSLAEITTLIDNYKGVAPSCSLWETAVNEIRAFEKELMRHIHFQNNILFPGAISLPITNNSTSTLCFQNHVSMLSAQ